MAKRDPEITARNKIMIAMKEERRQLQSKVFAETGIANEGSLNAIIGSKNNDFFDLRNQVIESCENFASLWLRQLHDRAQKGKQSSIKILKYCEKSEAFKEYLIIFLKACYLKHFDKLSKIRPTVEDATMWIGDNRLDFGLLVTPDFRGGQWENDKSEIRAAKFKYWTIGHILSTGLVIPYENRKQLFNSTEDYLSFFENVLVRTTQSPHEKELAGCYREFVLSSKQPEDIPLMIPQFRYGGIEYRHKYRLDFTIINPYTLSKVGIEISPWESHGKMSGITGLRPGPINAIAQKNFEDHAEKVRSYFKRHNISVISYTDRHLANSQQLFETDFIPLLTPQKPVPIISFEMKRKYGLL